MSPDVIGITLPLRQAQGRLAPFEGGDSEAALARPTKQSRMVTGKGKAGRLASPRRLRPLWALLTRSIPGVPDEEVELALMFLLQQLELLANQGRFVWSGPLGQDRSRGLTIFEAQDEAQAQETVAGFSPVQRRVWEVELLAPWEVDLREASR